MDEKKVVNQNIDKPIIVDGKAVKGNRFLLSPYYELDAYEFSTLINNSSDWGDRAKNVFYVGLGVFMSVVSKYLLIFVSFFQAKSENEMRMLQAKFEASEFISLGLVLFVWIVCYVISQMNRRGERAILIDKIRAKYKVY